MVRQRLPGGGANDTLLKKDGHSNLPSHSMLLVSTIRFVILNEIE